MGKESSCQQGRAQHEAEPEGQTSLPVRVWQAESEVRAGGGDRGSFRRQQEARTASRGRDSSQRTTHLDLEKHLALGERTGLGSGAEECGRRMRSQEQGARQSSQAARRPPARAHAAQLRPPSRQAASARLSARARRAKDGRGTASDGPATGSRNGEGSSYS
jgi:hypothetical protein